MNALLSILDKSPLAATNIERALQIVAEIGKEDTASLAAEEYSRLRAENMTLRLALRFYARGDNWTKRGGYCPISADSGAKARITLSTIGGS